MLLLPADTSALLNACAPLFSRRLAPAESLQAYHVVARHLIHLVHGWQPERDLVIVGARAYAVLEPLADGHLPGQSTFPCRQSAW